MAFSNAQLALLADAANRMLQDPAPELPIDGFQVTQVLASASVSTGFSLTSGQFLEAVKNKPISTLILFIAYAGGSGIVLPKQ
jgi:hypothetical protein